MVGEEEIEKEVTKEKSIEESGRWKRERLSFSNAIDVKKIKYNAYFSLHSKVLCFIQNSLFIGKRFLLNTKTMKTIR